MNGYQSAGRVHTSWREPLVAYASADDPLFHTLKDVVSPSHAMPKDLLQDAQTVIAYFLPFKKSLTKTNSHGTHASREWALAYIETNRLIVDLNIHLAEILDNWGFQTMKLPPTHNFDTERLVSDWSHKHVAYIAGLGKFGLHHLLITEKGCCGRLGSLITSAPLAPTTRTAGEACLYKFNKTCLKCLKRCPVGALNEESFDRKGCYDLLLDNAKSFEGLGLADVCGKCSCIVPCSFHNPVQKLSLKTGLAIGG